MSKNKYPIPVIMYHSVGIPNKNWQWYHLTMSYKSLDSQLKWVKGFKWKTIFLNELYDYIFQGKTLPENTCVITFDDGYVDNWVFVYPLLKKYNIKATIFVSPDFVDKRSIKRRRLDHITNKKELETLDNLGYLSWDEMKEMEDSGFVDIQSHALTHTWYPVSDKIIDFRHPGDEYIWMTWNNYPEKKPFLQYDNIDLVQLGEPVYEFEKSLSKRRYYPDPKLSAYLINYVKINGGKAFFEIKEWRKILNATVAEYKKQAFLNDKFETSKEYSARIKKELSDSKGIIETKLKKKVDFLCWPGGSSTSHGVEIARSLGFKLSTVGRDIMHSLNKISNSPKSNTDRVYRLGPGLYWNGIKGDGSIILYKKGMGFIISLLQFQKRWGLKYFGTIYFKVIKIFLHSYYRIINYSG